MPGETGRSPPEGDLVLDLPRLDGDFPLPHLTVPGEAALVGDDDFVLDLPRSDGDFPLPHLTVPGETALVGDDDLLDLLFGESSAEPHLVLGDGDFLLLDLDPWERRVDGDLDPLLRLDPDLDLFLRLDPDLDRFLRLDPEPDLLRLDAGSLERDRVLRLGRFSPSAG